MRSNAKDLTGQKFGRLTVLYPSVSKSKNRSIRWICSCSCNPEVRKEVRSSHLIYGATKSCGCLNREIVSSLGKKRVGPLSYNWNPNKTDKERKQDRKYPEYTEWRKAVYERDNYACQKCGDSSGGNLNAHHILGYADNKEERTLLSNGITLCKKCHKNYHHVYGLIATEETFNEWMKKE